MNDYYNDIDRQKDAIKKKYTLAEKDGFQKSLMESELKMLPERRTSNSTFSSSSTALLASTVTESLPPEVMAK